MTIFVDVEDVLQIHECVIRETGGGCGVRDAGLLESAVAQPHVTFGGVELCPSLEEKAAAICYSIVMNHPFVEATNARDLWWLTRFYESTDMSLTLIRIAVKEQSLNSLQGS